MTWIITFTCFRKWNPVDVLSPNWWSFQALRIVNTGKSQSANLKNLNLGRLIPKVSRLNLIGPVNTKVFIVFQPCLLFYNSKKYPNLSTP